MEYRIGTGKRIKNNGETISLTCPKCDCKVNMQVFSNKYNRLDSSFPFVNRGNVYFLVCPKCASIYTVDEAKGKNFNKGMKTSILDLDLKTLKEFKK